MKYSVIIPVYNAEKTLHRCVDSILDQNYPDMELILVNDGSKDGSLAICNAYQTRDARVRVINKPNGGVSTARNMGLDAATGEYVLFVDSDDYVAETYFIVLDAIDKLQKYDYVFFSHTIVGPTGEMPKILSSYASSTIDESYTRFCEAWYRRVLNEPWNKRYTRSIVEDNKLRFEESLYIGEDILFNLQYVLNCHSCLALSDCLYFVDIRNQESLSRKIRPDYEQQLEVLDRRINEMIVAADLSEKHRRQFLEAKNMIQLRSIYSKAKRMHITNQKFRLRRKEIRKLCKENNVQKASLPSGKFGLLLQIPVRLKMITVIDLMGWYLAR